MHYKITATTLGFICYYCFLFLSRQYAVALLGFWSRLFVLLVYGLFLFNLIAKMTSFGFILLFVTSYIVGSIPFGLLIGFRKNVDIRKHGSGNIGATNAARSMGMLFGVATLLLDGLKGIAIPLLFYKLPAEAKVVSFFGAFVGHVFSVFLKFNGGKGVATFFFTTMLIDTRMTSVFIIFWVIVALISRYASLASLMAFFGSTFYWMVKEQDLNAIGMLDIQHPMYSSYITAYCMACSIITIYKHRKNIVGILSKDERKIRFRKNDKQA